MGGRAVRGSQAKLRLPDDWRTQGGRPASDQLVVPVLADVPARVAGDGHEQQEAQRSIGEVACG